VSNIVHYWDSAVWDNARWAKYQAIWDNAVWDESYWGFCWSDMLDDNIARLEMESRGTFFQVDFFQPGLFTECKLLRDIIRRFES
jgi:hypothetical protein